MALQFGPKAPGPSKEKEGVLDEDKEKRLQQIRRNERAEKRRQRVCCNAMEDEEIHARAFYKWELLENLRERRLMRSEDTEGKVEKIG